MINKNTRRQNIRVNRKCYIFKLLTCDRKVSRRARPGQRSRLVFWSLSASVEPEVMRLLEGHGSLMMAGFASIQPWQRSHIAIKDSTLIYSGLSCVDIGFEYLYCEVAKL